MKKVFKYELPGRNISEIEMPIGAQILTIQAQGNTPQIWALVEEGKGLEKRKFRMAGTGHSIEDKDCQHYLGSFQLYGGEFVFHVFEIKE